MSGSAGNYYATTELAAHYDADYACRSDLPFYLALAGELQPAVVADIGAGTGLLCSRLAEQGHQVIGVEPQAAMLTLARAQPHAGAVAWIHGEADQLEDASADLVLMTGHVAQYFLDQAAWVHVLSQARRALRPGGHIAFELRNPSLEEWRSWADPEPKDIGWGTVRREVSQEADRVTHVDYWTQGRHTWRTSETLRFPSWDEVQAGIEAAALETVQEWGGWDKSSISPTSREWVFLLRRAGAE